MKIALFLIFIINISAAPLLDRVKELDDKIYNISKQIDNIILDLGKLEKKVNQSKLTIKKLKNNNKDLENKIKKRAKYLFKIINGKIFLSFADTKDALALERKEKFLKIIINNDLKIIKKYLLKLRELNIFIKKSEDEILILKKTQKSLIRQRELLKKEKMEKKKFIRNIKKSKKLKKKLRKEKEKYSKKLSEKLNKVKNKANSAFLNMKGKFNFPINSKVEKWYYVKYIKSTKKYDMHKGLTFRVDVGTKVQSIYKGSVVFATYIKGYGNTVIISHGGGYYTIYMHLNKINVKRGDKVKTNGIIALSGNTGSIEYPKLYFEIRNKKTPINLNKWFNTKK